MSEKCPKCITGKKQPGYKYCSNCTNNLRYEIRKMQEQEKRQVYINGGIRVEVS